jgi:hypothetical protein
MEANPGPVHMVKRDTHHLDESFCEESSWLGTFKFPLLNCSNSSAFEFKVEAQARAGHAVKSLRLRCAQLFVDSCIV